MSPTNWAIVVNNEKYDRLNFRTSFKFFFFNLADGKSVAKKLSDYYRTFVISSAENEPRSRKGPADKTLWTENGSEARTGVGNERGTSKRGWFPRTEGKDYGIVGQEIRI